MNKTEYIKLTQELKDCVNQIPIEWVTVQNNTYDYKFKVFDIFTFAELEEKLRDFNQNEKDYYYHRWFIWANAECDEYLFYSKDNVEKNSLYKGKGWDIKLFDDDDNKFDIKSTVIPKRNRYDAEYIINNPLNTIKFYYNRQSRGIRYAYQNRLFIIHHSFLTPDNDLNIRLNFDFKDKVIKEYIEKFKNHKLFKIYDNDNDVFVNADTIFIIENLDHSLSYKFGS